MFNLRAIHKKCSHHKRALLESPLCGCFFCLRVFPPSEITEWVRSYRNDTEKTCALCPHCSIDAVLPSLEVELTDELLRAMNAHWFGAGHCKSIVTIDEANAAKAFLEDRLRATPWLREIGIVESDADLYMLKVAVSRDSTEWWEAIPQSVDGVYVSVEEVGEGALDRERFFQEMQAGYAQMTEQDWEDDAKELTSWEHGVLPLEPRGKR